jgi:hypothetical protein
MEVKYVEAYGGSLLVVQQVAGEFQCLEGSLRTCLDACLDIIDYFSEFQIWHISRHKNQKANMLAQQASGYDVGACNFYIQEQPMIENLSFFRAGTDQTTKSTNQVGPADSLSIVAKSARPTTLVCQADSSKPAKPTVLVGSSDSPMTSLVTLPEKLPNRPDVISNYVGADLEDLRIALLRYLRDPSAKIDKCVRRSAFKYVLDNDELYRRTAEDLLLKCLGSDQARVAMGEVHEGILVHVNRPRR